jgi:hypothetical protein
MMLVRINVAKSESIVSIPTFAKIAVNAAKQADSTAQACQDSSILTGDYPVQRAKPWRAPFRMAQKIRSGGGCAWDQAPLKAFEADSSRSALH